MWIEEDIQKDTDAIQKSMQDITREYHAQLPRTIRSHITENKDITTDFFKKFYDKLRDAEYQIYRKSDVRHQESPHSSPSDVKLEYRITEIKNSANDLPHPRILSGLQRTYDIRRHNSGNNDDQYIPYKVYAYIREKSEFCIQFQMMIHGRSITIHFITFPESHFSVCSRNNNNWASSSSSSYLCSSEIAVYQRYAHKVFMWLTIITSLSDHDCSEKSLNIYFYMTPFKKQRPHDDSVLSAIHVNTGLTRNCETHGEIVVYRTEEWFKVFLHESMHNFNMDFIDQDLHDANARLRSTFCIPHGDILLFETYTETWARIINTMFNTYVQHEKSGTSVTQTQFIRGVREKLIQNAVFYAFQTVKVLDVMKLKYANITIQSPENQEMCRKRYVEDTNVYAYYILGGILSAYALPFITWCAHHNHGKGRIGAIRFSRNQGTLPKFVDFLCTLSRDPHVLSLITFIENRSKTTGSTASASHGSAAITAKTMRMTME